MKKVLFITFYWPPSGKASLHWPLKMIQYLPEYGWEPCVLTVNDDTVSAADSSLLGDIAPGLKVKRTGFFDPFLIYRKLTGKKGEILQASEAISLTNHSLAHRVSLWIRMNLFVPDARVGWYFHGLREGARFLRENPADLIITNGPPHSTHLIGKKLSRMFNVPFVAVFIDPWVDIATYRDFNRNPLTLKLDNYFEKSTLKQSSASVFVTRTMDNYFLRKYPFLRGRTEVINWGYNEQDFEGLKAAQPSGSKKVILHAGNIYDHQNPVKFWKLVRSVIESGKMEIELRFIGTVSPAVMQSLEDENLMPHFNYLGFLPYKEVLSQMLSADYLLTCTHEPRHVPGKLYEYMRVGKPVIAFGDDNEEVGDLLSESGSGILIPYNEIPEDLFGQLDSLKPDNSAVKKFDRKALAGRLAQVLDRLL